MHEQTLDYCLGAGLLGLGALLWTQLEGLPIEGTLFPAALICFLAVCSLAIILRAFLQGKGAVVHFFGETPVRQWFTAVIVFAIQCIIAMYVSFLVGMALGMTTLLILLSPQRTARSIVCSLLFVGLFLGAIEFFFSSMMHIYFPETLF